MIQVLSTAGNGQRAQRQARPAPATTNRRGGGTSILPSVTFLGGSSRGGTYVLQMHLSQHISLSFGRFKNSKVISLQPGSYIYIGSALADIGATCLARRLVRHASRTGAKPPHVIRDHLVAEFQRVGLGQGDLVPMAGKHLRWNIDHFLDHECVELVGACVIRSPRRIEREVGQLLQDDPATVVFERGVGANDLAGNTHLLRVESETFWSELPRKLGKLISIT